ncbi:aromatic ring-hydroxylating dioxygenase subunit alpha [Oceanobacter sp. 3_MG-2023]|uniref:aromatic ring-hydroxylating oxygenase subunit alpha n=1 Tax=Oceanobacter sp. 3_MG-2023 TaxID=3062622 RepID=UPI0027334336|nr:SRPBCC family protein [Oceanobacter sp. 3_MG-2023]MDP2506018.1 SRPBCC family protein [Oceanobacter sp. 3_MG-2023]
MTQLNSPKPVGELVAALRENCDLDFTNARAMPPEVYTSAQFTDLEQNNIFRKQWLCVGHVSRLPNVGDYLTSTIGDQPVVVLRDNNEHIRALSNVCLHRMSELLQGTGNVSSIVCPYHAWGYNLEGQLRGAPQMNQQNGFCKSHYQLPAVRCEEWQGWIYITLNEALPPVKEQLAALADLVGHYHMESYVEAFHEEHVWDCNWKILAENFMESYHLPIVHKATVGPHTRLSEVECPPGHPTFNYHWFTKEATLAIGNAHPDNHHLEGHWRKTSALISIYPSHLITLTPGYFWYLVLQPRGADQVSISFGGGMAPEYINDPKAAEYLSALKDMLDVVNAEDRTGVEAVMRGVRAPLAKAGQLSHLERPLYDFARYISEQVGSA